MVSVKPIKGIHENVFKQSQHEHLPRCPLRGLLCAPSAGGKSVLATNIILEFYKGVFDKVFYFSASADLDPALSPIRKYCIQELGMDPDKEECLHSKFDLQVLENIIARQRSALKQAKLQRLDVLPQVLLIIDDFADDPKVARGEMLKTLFVRGRHSGVSTIVMTQKVRLIQPAVRVNASFYIVFRLKNFQDLSSIIEEMSALVDKKTVRALYEHATAKPYSFLYVNLQAKDLQTTFYRNFESRLVVNSSSQTPIDP